MGLSSERIHAAPADKLAFMAVDASCHFIEWDAGAEQLLGYAREEVLGRMPFEILLDHSELQRVADFFITMMAGPLGREELYRTYPVNPRVGKPCKGGWYHQQLVGVDGRICGIAVLITPALQTEHQPMWDCLASRTAELERQVRSRTRLVSEWHNEIARQAAQPAGPAERLAKLTQREADIIAELSAGKRPKSIARDMQISHHTVRNHIKSIFRKLDVHSQEALISLFRVGC